MLTSLGESANTAHVSADSGLGAGLPDSVTTVTSILFILLRIPSARG